MQVTHVVGEQGSGKTPLIHAIVASLQLRGARCAQIDYLEAADKFSGDVLYMTAEHAGVDHLFIEHLPAFFDGGKPGDRVITITNLADLPSSQPVAQQNHAQAATECVAPQAGA